MQMHLGRERDAECGMRERDERARSASLRGRAIAAGARQLRINSPRASRRSLNSNFFVYIYIYECVYVASICIRSLDGSFCSCMMRLLDSLSCIICCCSN